MSKIFTRTFRVRWSELDANGQVSLGAYLRYLVETAYDWGDTLGLGAQIEEGLGLFWLIRETEIHILRPLHHNDIFDFTIWMVNWQRVRGSRCFEITLKETGEIIAQGSQHIVCMDRKTGRPTNPPEAIIDNFRLSEPRIFPFERFPKITPPQSIFTHQRQVEWQDLDALKHVNNATYPGYAEEATALELSACGWSPEKLVEHNLQLQTHRLHIQYLSPAVWGETLVIATHSLDLQPELGSRYVGITRLDGSVVAECILDWKFIDHETGTVRQLPDELLESLFR